MASLLPGNIIYSGEIFNEEIMNCRSLGQFIVDKLKQSSNNNLMVIKESHLKSYEFVPSHKITDLQIDAVTGEKYSGKMILDSTVRLAYVLQSLGIKSADVVGISSENRYEFAIVLYACFAINATVAPINLTYSEGEMHHAMNLSKPNIMFVSKQTTERIFKVAQNNSFVKHVVSFDPITSNSKIHSFKELMVNLKITSQTDFYCPSANKEEDVALIVCSSGTTGLPKGVQLTQTNILTGVDPTQLEVTSLSLSELPTLTVIPWFHIFGCLTLISAAVMRSTLVFLPKFVQHDFLNAIEKYRIMMAFMVPPLMVFLAKHPDVDNYDLCSLKVLYCGAAPLSRDTEDLIKNRIGVPIIRQGYGLSETTRGVTVQNDRYCKPGSVGGLKKGVYAKVVDSDTGKTLGPNQCGELCFKGSYIMKGYIGDIKSTEAVVKDGWLHSGDIGYYDEDFEFFIVDRIKELIKYKAFQVPPAEIEALLLTNPKIKDAAVVGKPDDEAGELPMAFIVKQDKVDLTEDEVIKFVGDRTSPAKRLRGGVLFIEEIPKNPSGKILRRILRDMLKKMLKSKL